MRSFSISMERNAHGTRKWPARTALAIAMLVSTFAARAEAQPLSERYQQMRNQMVAKYIEPEGIKDRRVLDSMRTVPRHEFMLLPTRHLAYEDGAYPIGHQQTISPPFIVAYMTESIQPGPNDKVLEIGTGSGYQAAVLAEIAKEVYSIEIVEPLGKSAAKRLKRLGYDNVKTRVGDGYKGWPEYAPFDKIIVTCSPEDVPSPLVQQLKEGGKMIVPLGERYQQVFYLFEKKNGRLQPERLIPTLFVPMTGASEEQRKVLPNAALPEIINPGFETDANEDGRTDNWHYQRQVEWIREDAKEGDSYVRFTNDTPGKASQMLQGLALDGKSLGRIRVRLWVRHENSRRGNRPGDRPGLVVHFYDRNRKPLGNFILGPWIGTEDWQRVSQVFEVPVATRELIVRVGLNGGTGQLDIDGIELERQRR